MSQKRDFKGQLSFDFELPKEQDRNFHLGGRSFYFFDFDDNVVYLSTPIILFHKDSGAEVSVSSGEYAHESRSVGKTGRFADFFIDINDDKGSFRHFRDKEFTLGERAKGVKQTFVSDIERALENAEHVWKAPSWNSFYQATYNQRPVSVITARGHGRETIKDGIDMMVREGHLPLTPKYHSIYPVSNLKVRHELGDFDLKKNVAELKRVAIRASVEKAIKEFGYSPFHRFGMSDDDHKNIELICEEMRTLKRDYPDMSFYVIETFKDAYAKYEILEHETREVVTQAESRNNQLSLL